MKQREDNSEWFIFFSSVMHLDFYYKNKVIPKYILYWRGFLVKDLKGNNYTNLKAIIRP